MAGLKDLDLLECQLMTIFHDDDSLGQPVAKQCLQRQRHARRGFAATGEEYVVERGQVIGSLLDLCGVISELNRLCDCCERVSRLHACEKNVPSVRAQLA